MRDLLDETCRDFYLIFGFRPHVLYSLAFEKKFPFFELNIKLFPYHFKIVFILVVDVTLSSLRFNVPRDLVEDNYFED